MRKIVLAAAIAGSALGLAACAEAETEADETAADMEAVADDATAEVEEAAVEDGLLPASETQIVEPEFDPQKSEEIDADSVFKNFGSLGGDSDGNSNSNA